jgi:D-alanine--poly(phosphoribitol) ligase subunit 2
MLVAEQVVGELREIFADTFHVRAPAHDADLLEEGILDSFQFVELLVQLEARFDLKIDIADIDLDELRTLDSLARLLARKSLEAGKPPAATGIAAHGER